MESKKYRIQAVNLAQVQMFLSARPEIQSSSALKKHLTFA
jgi:hypothetical protein